MKALTEEQQRLFDTETIGLEHSLFNPSSEFIESLGFEFTRYLQLANFKGDDAELEIFENSEGLKVIKLCVFQKTFVEGDLCHPSCYAPAELLPQFENEHNKFSINI